MTWLSLYLVGVLCSSILTVFLAYLEWRSGGNISLFGIFNMLGISLLSWIGAAWVSHVLLHDYAKGIVVFKGKNKEENE